MGKCLSRFLGWLVSAVSILMAVGIIGTIFLSRTPTIRRVEAAERAKLPDFPFEIVKQLEITNGYGKAEVLLISKEHFSEPNLRRLLLWRSAENPKPVMFAVRVFTEREKAVSAPLGEGCGGGPGGPIPYFWKRLFLVYPWDALYWRYSKVDGPVVSEDYQYKRLLSFPYWMAQVILK
jgi:hypothetical protein